MKPIYAKLIAMTGLLAVMNSPALAQESSPKTADAPPPSRRSSPPRDEPMRGSRQVEEKPAAFIGVLTANVPRELRSHFALPEGFGLLVEEVMPDTPAQAAGIKVDDILVRFEDQKLVNMDQLQTLVRSQQKGDLVTLTLISGGMEKQVSVTVGERMMPVRPDEPRRGEGLFQPFGGSSFFGEERGNPDMMNEMRESMERYQKQMREYQERMRDWSRDGRNGDMPNAPSWNGPGRRDNDRGPSSSRGSREGEHRVERHEYREAANVTRSDDSGIYSLRREGDRNVFTAKPKDGKEQSWNLNSEEERQAIPEPMREKLRLLEEIRGHDNAVEHPRVPLERDGNPRLESNPPKR